jgi:(p)ppGpp synthase/HD superfamily hydrolase
MERLVKAYDFAARKHKLQKRKDPEQTPYINHPIGVSLILTSANVTDVDTLIAAILHDTVEDTDTTLDEITHEFGSNVAMIVEQVTDDKTLGYAERKAEQVRSAPFKCNQAKLVKLADKIYNLRDLKRCAPVGWSAERVTQYFIWAKQVTDGCKGVNPILEALLEELYQ